MKRSLWVLVSLFVVLAMSCASTGGGGGSAEAAPAAAAPAGGNLGAFNLILADNFQYGVTYQGGVTNRNMLNGHKIEAGETYTLQVKFTVSRDLEQELEFGFVDTTETANWWTQLSWDDDLKVDPVKIPAPKAGEEISGTYTIKTIRGASGSSANANSLMFYTQGEGVKGRAGSGVKKQVTISFSEFILTKVE